MTSIGQGAFRGSKLTSVVIPNSVKIIGGGAFSGLQLTSVIIGDAVTEIGIGAFEGNLAITSISIPDKLETLGSNAFDRNYSLTSILYCGKITGFPITPTCPPERKALIDSQTAAKLPTKQDDDARAAADLAAKTKAALDRVASLKKVTITCTRGKLIKKVTSIKPKCPTGYKLK